MTWVLIATIAAATPWIERYFGVGSGGDAKAACEKARDHAQGNSFRACMERRGTRSDATYTACACASPKVQLHVCNVNLQVSCEARGANPRPGGESEGPGGTQPQVSPGPEASPHRHPARAGTL